MTAQPARSHLLLTSNKESSMNIELKVRIDPKLIAKIIALIAVILA